jgi:hypothetical protein
MPMSFRIVYQLFGTSLWVRMRTTPLTAAAAVRSTLRMRAWWRSLRAATTCSMRGKVRSA